MYINGQRIPVSNSLDFIINVVRQVPLNGVVQLVVYEEAHARAMAGAAPSSVPAIHNVLVPSSMPSMPSMPSMISGVPVVPSVTIAAPSPELSQATNVTGSVTGSSVGESPLVGKLPPALSSTSTSAIHASTLISDGGDAEGTSGAGGADGADGANGADGAASSGGGAVGAAKGVNMHEQETQKTQETHLDGDEHGDDDMICIDARQ